MSSRIEERKVVAILRDRALIDIAERDEDVLHLR